MEEPDDAKFAEFLKLSEHQIAAMDGLIAFSEAMTQGRLSIRDLQKVFAIGVDSGRGMLLIQLSMARMALSSHSVVAEEPIEAGQPTYSDPASGRISRSGDNESAHSGQS